MKTNEYRAAGGIVLDSSGRVLLIERDVMRDKQPVHELRLPKGHVEPGETDIDAALREVCEETGYCYLDMVADLGEELNEFVFAGQRVRRTEHYFLLRLCSQEQGAQHFDDPASEEALFRTRWSPNLPAAAGELTFESERHFVRLAISAGDAGLQHHSPCPQHPTGDHQDTCAFSSSVLNLETLAELRMLQADSGCEIIAEMVDTYLCNTPQRLAVLRQAIAERDMATLIWTAHSLKGASGVFGAHCMVELCDQLQHAGASAQDKDLKDWVEQLTGEFERVQVELMQLKAESSQDSPQNGVR